jgi:hypothetical protein
MNHSIKWFTCVDARGMRLVRLGRRIQWFMCVDARGMRLVRLGRRIECFMYHVPNTGNLMSHIQGSEISRTAHNSTSNDHERAAQIECVL